MSRNDGDLAVPIGEVLGFLFRGALLAIPLAALAAFGVYQWSTQQEPEYRAEATVLVAQSGADFSQFGLGSVTAPPIDISAYRSAATSDDVLTTAARTLGTESPDASDVRDLRGHMDVFIESGVQESSMLTIEADAESPDVASARADAVADALVEWDRSRAREGLSRVVDALEEQVASLSEQIRALQTVDGGDEVAAGGDEAVPGGQVEGLITLRANQQQELAYARALIASSEGRASVLQYATTTPSQVAPRPTLSAAIAALLTLALVYGLLLLRNAATPRLRDAEEASELTGLPVLAQIPRVGRKQANRFREATAYLRSNVLAATGDAKPRTILVTSAVGREGKSVVSAGLAEALARHGLRTLLVDADLRSPSLAARYPVLRAQGHVAATHEWMREPGAALRVGRVPVGGDRKLDVIPQYGAVRDAPELLGRGFDAALAHWKRDYDVIVIDSAPILAVADSLTMAPSCSGAMLVVDRQRNDRNRLRSAVDLLAGLNVRVLGLALNNQRNVARGGAYGYGYGSGYDHDPSSEAPSPTPARVRPLHSVPQERAASSGDGGEFSR